MEYKRRYHKKLEKLIHAADQMREENAETVEKLNYNLLRQKIQTTDFLRTQNLVKLSDYATGKMV